MQQASRSPIIPGRFADIPSHRRRALGAAALAMAVYVSGCSVGPNFKRPDGPKAGGYSRQQTPLVTSSANTDAGGAQRFHVDRDIPGEWWKLFHNEPLNALIKRSLQANPDVKAAQAAVRVANENVLAQK